MVDGKDGDDLKDYVLCNSAEYTGLKVPDAVDKILERLEKVGVGKQATEYRLRDWLVSRQRYWGVPIPIVFCENCGEVSLDQLPLLLPET